MAYLARVDYPNATGSEPSFAVPFDYLSESHIHAYQDGVEISQLSITFLSPTSVSFPHVAGDILIRRITPNDAIIATIQSGSIRPADVNVDTTQLLYLTQEAADAVQAVQDEVAEELAAVVIAPVVLPSNSSIVFTTQAQFKAYSAAADLVGVPVYVRGLTADMDGAQGWWEVFAGTTTDNGGIAINLNDGTHYAKRIFSGNWINCAWFGIKSSNSAAANDSKMATFAALPYDLYFSGGGTIQYTSVVTITRSNFKMTCAPDTLLKQTGTNANSVCFLFSAVSNVQAEGMRLTPGTTVNSSFHGWGLLFENCTNCVTRGTEITGHRVGGIGFIGGSDNRNLDHYIHDSVVSAGAGDTSSSAGWDLLIANGAVRTHSKGGLMVNGCGISAAIQTIDSNGGAGYTFTDVSITGYSAYNSHLYGGLIYKLSSNDVFDRVLLSADVIDTVTGDIPHPVQGYVFGAGIYIQGVDGAVARAGIIKNTNVNTAVETLAPGAIGIANCYDVDVDVSYIQNANWYALAVFNSNALGDNTNRPVSRVRIGESKNAGIIHVKVKDFPNLLLHDSVFLGGSMTTTGGLDVSNVVGSTTERVTLENCFWHDIPGRVFSATAGDLIISGGELKAASTADIGLLYTAAAKIFMENFTIDCANTGTVTPLQIGGSVTDAAIGKNVTIKCPTGGTGAGKIANLSAPVRGLDDLRTVGASATFATAWPGSFSNCTKLADTATPSVKDLQNGRTGGTTNISGFTNMVDGQTFTLFVDHTMTLQNSSSFKLQGGSNLSVALGNVVPFKMIQGVVCQVGAASK